MKISITGMLKFIIDSLIMYKVDYGGPSEKTARHQLTFFRSIRFEWEAKTKH